MLSSGLDGMDIARSGHRPPAREYGAMDPISSVSDLLAVLARGNTVRDEPTLDGLAHGFQVAFERSERTLDAQPPW